jgi:hypothetical protein
MGCSRHQTQSQPNRLTRCAQHGQTSLKAKGTATSCISLRTDSSNIDFSLLLRNPICSDVRPWPQAQLQHSSSRGETEGHTRKGRQYEHGTNLNLPISIPHNVIMTTRFESTQNEFCLVDGSWHKLSTTIKLFTSRYAARRCPLFVVPRTASNDRNAIISHANDAQ